MSYRAVTFVLVVALFLSIASLTVGIIALTRKRETIVVAAPPPPNDNAFVGGGGDNSDDSSSDGDQFASSSPINVDYLSVGGGAGGLSWGSMLTRALARKGVKPKDMSVAIVEMENEVGGNVKWFKLAEPDGYVPANGFGPLYADIGPARVTQMTLGLERANLIYYNISVEFSPWRNVFQSRGKRIDCAPNINYGSGATPVGTTEAVRHAIGAVAYATTAGCASDDAFINPETGVFKNIVASGGSPQGYTGAPADDIVYHYLNGGIFGPSLSPDEPDLNNGEGAYNFDYDPFPHPVTGEICTVGENCPLDDCAKYGDDVATQYARALRYVTDNETDAQYFNHEASLYMREIGNFGFEGDFTQQQGCKGYAEYNMREFNTNSMYGYPHGGMRSLIMSMKKEFQARGGKIYLGERVTRINYGSGKCKFDVLTTKRRFCVREFLAMNTPPYFLFDGTTYDSTSNWAGKALGGAVVDALRAVPELGYSEPQKTIKIVIQFEPGVPHWWWALFDQDGVWSVRKIGSGGAFSRLEMQEGRSFRCRAVIIPVYTDDRYEIMWAGYIAEWKRTGDDALLKRRLQEELQHSFPDVYVNETIFTVGANYFPSAWYGTRRGAPDAVSSTVVMAKAANPLPGKSICMVGQGYGIPWQGWIEEPLRLAKRCLMTRLKTKVPTLQTVYDEVFAQIPEVVGDGSTAGVSDCGFNSWCAYTPTFYSNPNTNWVKPHEYFPPHGPFPANDFCNANAYDVARQHSGPD